MSQLNRIPEDVIRRIVEETDLVTLVGEQVRLKRQGKNYVGLCPFHQEKTPSFTVAPTKGFYHCFGCGAHGTAIDFVMETGGHKFRDAVSLLASRLGITVTYQSGENTSFSPQERLKQFERNARLARYYAKALPGSPAEDYLTEQRGISLETARAFQLGYGKNRLIFPIRDRQGRVAGFTARALDGRMPKYINSAQSAVFDKSRLLYGLYEVLQVEKRPDWLYVVEGSMDVVALHQAGITQAVAPLGTSFSLDQARMLYQITNRVALVFDGDQAGQKATIRALNTVLPVIDDGRYLKIVTLDQGDPDELVRSQGPEAFRQVVEKAPLLSEWLQVPFRRQFPAGAEGQGQYLRQVHALVEKMPPSTFKNLLRKELGLDSVIKGKQSRFRRVNRQRYGNYLDATNACDRLLAIVLHFPETACQIDQDVIEALPQLFEAKGNLAARLIQVLAQDTHVAMLQERLRGHPAETQLLRWLAMWVPENRQLALDLLQDISKELLTQCQKQARRRLIEQTLRKPAARLTPEEQRRLDDYLREIRRREAKGTPNVLKL